MRHEIYFNLRVFSLKRKHNMFSSFKMNIKKMNINVFGLHDPIPPLPLKKGKF